MKLIHLADLHIGKTLNDFSLIEDQEYFLHQVIRLIEENQVDAVAIAGDVYDRSVPSEEAVRIFDSFLCLLAQKHIRTYVISGNHDSDERLNFASSLIEKSGIHIAARYEGQARRFVLEDEYGPVNLWLLPFLHTSQARHYHPDAQIESYEDAVRISLQHPAFDPGQRNVLVAHLFAAGRGAEPVLSGSESAGVLNVGSLERVGTEVLGAFDYAALGHIHSPQKLGSGAARYAGSPLKYSLSEAESEKSVPLVTLGKKGDVSVQLIPIRPLRNLRHIRGRLTQLLDPKNRTDTEDFIHVTLTDEEPIPNAMRIMQTYYPNAVHLDYDNAHTRLAQDAREDQTEKPRGFRELIGDFYRERFGCEMSPEEAQIMWEIAEEAGVSDASC